MLRFEQFIPHLFYKEHWSMRYRAYPEHAFHTIELAASVYSHPCFSQKLVPTAGVCHRLDISTTCSN